MGLGRVKTDLGGTRRTRVFRPRSRLSADPCQIVSQDRESHFSGYFRKRFGQEVCRSHAGLHRAERMFDRLPTLAHGLWVCIKAQLHSIEQMLMRLPYRYTNEEDGKMLRRYWTIQPVKIVHSNPSARQAQNGGFHGGSTQTQLSGLLPRVANVYQDTDLAQTRNHFPQ